MREILFRAKAINRYPDREYRTNYKNGAWVYGLVTAMYDDSFPNLPAEMKNIDGISDIDVDHRTIGQYTGLTDKNGVKIFEGDIIRYGDTIHKVVFEQRNGTAYFGLVYSPIETLPFGQYQDLQQLEVIGNIYDNPELIGGEADEQPRH